MLCENPWEGGGGYTPTQVGQMTLDQAWSRLCDSDLLRPKGQRKKQSLEPLAVTSVLKPDEAGRIKGRAADGTLIMGRICGKSLARQLMKQEEERKKEEEKKKSKKRRRRRGT